MNNCDCPTIRYGQCVNDREYTIEKWKNDVIDAWCKYQKSYNSGFTEIECLLKLRDVIEFRSKDIVG